MPKFKRSPLRAVSVVAMLTGGCMDHVPPIEGVASDTPTSPLEEAPSLFAADAGSASPSTTSADGGTSPHLPFHVVTVTLCSRDKDTCALAQAKALDAVGEGSSYRVAFGSTVGSIRSHQQALADVYRELRDRTQWGTHLACQGHSLVESTSDGGIPSNAGIPARPPASNASSDAPTGAEAMTSAALQVMLAVDNLGEVTIDVGPTRGGCSVSLSESGADRCLVGVPPRKSAPSKGGLSF